MNVYLCRRPNGIVSLVIGSNRQLLHELLEETGVPDSVEIFSIKHNVAVHFRLKSNVSRHETITEYLDWGGIDEHTCEELSWAFPVLSEVLGNADATQEQIALAVEEDKHRLDDTLVDSPDKII